MIKRLILIAFCSVAAIILLKDLYVSKSLVLKYKIESVEKNAELEINEINLQIYYKDKENSVFDKERSVFEQIKLSESKELTAVFND